MEADDFEVVVIFRELFRDLNINGYLVGGAIRDIILGINPIDFDFTVELNEGEHLKKSKEISRLLNCPLKYNNHYHTAKFEYKGNDIDFVMARKEFYDGIAAKPRVMSSNIIDDILRRDFTVNSIAMKMGELNYGMIIDPTEGAYDIKNGVIKVHHINSFKDDPTRFFRGIKYASRFNFKFESETYFLMKECLEKGYIKHLSPQRLTQELYRIMDDSNISGGLYLLEDLSAFNAIIESDIQLNLCYNKGDFNSLPNKKKMVVLFYYNSLESLLKLKEKLFLGDEFIEDIDKLREVEINLLNSDRSVYRFLYKKQNKLDFRMINALFNKDRRIENFINYRNCVKISSDEISSIDNKSRESFIIDKKVEELISLIGG